MSFYYKGNFTTDLGEHYMEAHRAGFTHDRASKKLVLAALDHISPGVLPLGTVVKIEKLYRMKRGYEPNAPFRHGDLAEVWTLRLKAHGTWHNPKTGKAEPAKWATINHVSRQRSGEDFRDPKQKEKSAFDWLHERSARHERGDNPRVKYGRREPTLQVLSSTYSVPRAGTIWAQASLAERRQAYTLAYPGRDVGGWDLGFADKNAAKFLKAVKYANAHPRDPLSRRIRKVLRGG
jgi:hypothetical protein